MIFYQLYFIYKDDKMKSQGGFCMEKELNWAVIGTGVIANEMAQALQRMDKTLYGVANRTQAKLLILQRSMVLKKSMMKLMKCLMMKMLILFIWQHHIIRIINL